MRHVHLAATVLTREISFRVFTKALVDPVERRAVL
jgi:hypothetical protein